MSFRIVGVYRVPEEMFGDEERPPDEGQWPYLFEVELPIAFEATDWRRFTQSLVGQPRSNWQAPKDEEEVAGAHRAIFYFHCVQWEKPLTTPFGDFAIPRPSAMPAQLKEAHTYFWG